jgi:hypothetical protein
MGNISEHQYMMKTAMNAKVHTPRVRVSFHTEKACYQADAKTVNKYGEALDPNYPLLSVTTQKGLDSPAGAFTIQLAGTQWATYLSPNDLVVIQMGYAEDKTLTTVMVGFIDDVRRKRSIGNGVPTTGTTVTGRDFGKVLLNTQLKFYPEIGMAQGAKEEKFFLTEDGTIALMKFFTNDQMTKGSPAVIIDNIMRHILLRLNDVRWKAYDERGKSPKPKTVGLANMLRYQLAKVDFFLPMMLTADQYEGALWNLMERASVKPFTELWVDTRSAEEAWNPSMKGRAVPDTVEESSSPAKAKLKDGAYPSPAFQFGEDGAKVLLCLRPTPFDSKHKERIVRHTLEQVDVQHEELGRSDSEHYNLFWAGTTVNPLGIDLKRVSPPLFNEHHAKKYGIKPLEVQIEGLAIEQAKKNQHTVALDTLTKNYTARLKAWFEHNHAYWNGTLSVRGNARIRVGHMVDYRAGSFMKEFYVENVSHSFSVFEDWTTSLKVTRGQTIGAKVDFGKNVPKPPSPKPKPKPAPKDSYHTVKSGDTLWALAGKYYSKNTDWRKIWEANKSMLIARDKRNAYMQGHWIYPGQKLRIPPK